MAYFAVITNESLFILTADDEESAAWAADETCQKSGLVLEDIEVLYV